MACVRLIGLPQDCVHLRDSSGGSVAKFCPRQSYREFRPFSGGDVEQGIDEGGLGDDVVPTQGYAVLPWGLEPARPSAGGCSLQ
jgi:hypothetical protein